MEWWRTALASGFWYLRPTSACSGLSAGCFLSLLLDLGLPLPDGGPCWAWASASASAGLQHHTGL